MSSFPSYICVLDEFGYYSDQPWLPETPLLLAHGAPAWQFALVDRDTFFLWGKLSSLVEALTPETRDMLKSSPSACRNLIDQAKISVEQFLQENPSWCPCGLTPKVIEGPVQGFYNYALGGFWPLTFSTPAERQQSLLAYLRKENPALMSQALFSPYVLDKEGGVLRGDTFECRGRVYVRDNPHVLRPSFVPNWLDVPEFSWKGVLDTTYLEAVKNALAQKEAALAQVISDDQVVEALLALDSAYLDTFVVDVCDALTYYEEEPESLSSRLWQASASLLEKFPRLNALPPITVGALQVYFDIYVKEEPLTIADLYSAIVAGVSQGGRILIEDPSRAEALGQLIRQMERQLHWEGSCTRALATDDGGFLYADIFVPQQHISFAEIFEKARGLGFCITLADQNLLSSSE